ncbi:MAG: CIA30 family protein [Planctomycetes bacterium]|nr:CIA30 family protein [Planctomycetota bacterium]
MPSRTCRRFASPVLAACILACPIPHAVRAADESILIDDGENAGPWRAYSGKPMPEISRGEAGHGGAAIKVTFAESGAAQFVGRGVKGSEAWDPMDGISFWFKGDGSDGFVAVSLIDDSYTKRYAALVSLKTKDWRQVKLRWDDFVPEVVSADWFGQKDGNMKPSLVRALWFGRWFYNRPWSACAFEIDDVRIEPKIDAPSTPVPEAGGFPRTLAKLKAKQPVVIVALGDSITYGTHVPEREKNAYPALLQDLLRKKFGYEGVTVLNKGIGGLETRQGIVLLPREIGEAPPDLVTVHFGYNDLSSMLEKRLSPEDCAALAGRNLRQLISRVRVLSGGRTEILLVATIPGADEARHHAMDFFGEQGRATAEELKCGFSAAPRTAFQEALKAGKLESLFVKLDGGERDVAHPNSDGQRLFAEALLHSFE